MFVIEGKVALVTGALGGIGQWYTKALLHSKVKGVALLDINADFAKKFENELQETYGPGRTLFIMVDLADTKQIEDAFEKAVKHFNQLDIVINNAGIIDEVNVERCIQVNFTATTVSTNLAMTKYLPAYRKGEEGVIVNTSSISAFFHVEGLPTYVATKQAVMTLGRCLGTSDHYDLLKARILTIVPGGTPTPIYNAIENLPSHMLPSLNKLARPAQKPECLGPALIKILLEGQNGSVWVVENGNPPIEIHFSASDNFLIDQLEKL